MFLSTVLAQDPGRETHDWMIRIYHHTSQLRASTERAPLNSPSSQVTSCSARLSWSSLIFLWGDAAVVVVVCRALCSHLPRPLSPVLRLSFPPPPPFLFAVRCAWKRRWCVSPAAGGTKFAARTAISPRCCGYRGTVHCAVFVVGRNKQGRCFPRASPPVASGRLRSPPVAPGRLRSPPVASGRLRSPPVASGRLRSPPVTSSRPHSLTVVGSGPGGAWGGSRWVVGHCFSARTRFGD